MSEIKTAVLEINTGGAITNIKEFKQHIEDLKGKLLALEKGTEEYSAVASELRSSQEKLNEVMDVAKGRGEAVAGSYDNLVATMRELKKEWRATGDAVERQKLGEQILTINNQLKELDASTGNFQRNVGDYSNAFEKAFDKVLGGIAGSDSGLAKLAGNIKNLIPVIKSVNQVATTGLKGIKAAIASTGIGLLVVALGEIVAHWSDITNWIGKATGLQKDYTKEVEKTRKETKQIRDDFKKLTDQENIMYLRLELEGMSKLDALNEKTKIITDKSFNAIHSLDSTLSNTGNRILWFKDKVLKDFGFSKEQLEYFNQYREGLGITSDELVDLSRREKKHKDVLEAKAQQIQQVIDINLHYINSLRETQLQVEQEKINEEKRARDLKKTSEEALMSESALLTKRYKENKALMEKYHIDTTALTRKYYKDLRDIAIKNKVNIEDVIFTSKSGDFDKIKNEINKFYNDISNYNTSVAVKNYNENLSLLNKQLDDGTISYTDYLNKLKELSSTYSKEVSVEHYQFKRNALEKEYNDNKNTLTKAENDELKQLQNIADKRKKELDGYLKDGKISTEEYQKETKKVDEGLLTAQTEVHNRYIQTKEKLDAQYLAQTKNLTVEEAKETASLALNAINIEFDRKLSNLNLSKRLQDSIKDLPNAIGGIEGLFSDFKANPDIFSSADIDKNLQEVLDYNNQVLEITREKNNEIIQQNELLLQSLPEGSQEALDAMNAISAAKIEMQNAETENVIANTEAQDEAEEQLADRRNKRMQMYSDGLKSIGSILDMVAQQQQKEIQEEVKDGKIGEEQAKQRFEDTKKLQIASAIINMAAGVVSAIASAQQLGPIAGPIAAAVNAAAVITAGVIQIANINKTKFGSTSVGSTTTPNVAEVSNDYTPQYTQNVTTDSELTELSNAINSKPLYVSVTDIDSVQDTVRTRENEATY